MNLPEHFFDQAFDKGLSTLRLIRYPVRMNADQTAEANPDLWVMHRGDHLWATTTKFVEFKGMEPLRKPLRS